MDIHRRLFNQVIENRVMSIKPLYMTRHIGKTHSVHQGLYMRATTADLYQGNQARIINLKTKHDTKVYSVPTRRRPATS